MSICHFCCCSCYFQVVLDIILLCSAYLSRNVLCWCYNKWFAYFPPNEVCAHMCLQVHMPVYAFETGPLTECRVRLESSKAQNTLSEAHPLHMALQDYMDYMFGHVWLFMWVLVSNIRSSHSYSKHSYSVSHVTSSTFRFQWFVVWCYGARKGGILVFSFLWL